MSGKFMGRLLAALAFSALVVSTTACGELPDDAAVKVDDVEITKADVENRIEGLRKSYGPVIPQEDADKDGEADCEFSNFRRDTTEQLVEEALVKEEAGKMGLSVSDEEIEDAIQTTADEGFLGDVERLMQSYYDRGFTEEELRADIERTLLHGKLMDEAIGRIEVDDDEIQAYYDRNIEQYQQPERRTVRQLVTNDEASARSAVERARSGEDFIGLVRELSVDPEVQEKIGSQGLVNKGDLTEPLDEVVFSLQTLEVSEPIQMAGQWYVLRVETIIPPVDIPLEQEKENIRAFATNEKSDAKWNKFMESMYADASIEYNSDYDPELRDDDCLKQ